MLTTIAVLQVEAATANLAEHEQHSAQAQHPAATRTNDGQQVLQLKLQQLEESAASAQQREDALHTQLQEQQRTLMATNATVVELEGKIALHKDSLAAAAAKHVAATKLGLSKGVQHAHCQTTEEQQQGQVLDHKSEPVQTDPQHFPSTAPYGSEQHVGHQTDAMSDSEVDPLQDTPFSKTQSSPASTLDASPHLQEQLACQKQLTKELTDTVAKLTAQLAQNTPDTPSPGHLRGHPTATPVTSPTGDATPDSSPASSREYSSQADSADAAQPIKLLTKFQQSDDEAAGESHGQATMVKNQGHASEAVDSAVSRIGSADDDTQVESDSVAASQVSSPLQLSPPESAPSSPSVTRAPGSSAEQTQGNGFRPVMHVNDSFDASDEEGLPSPAAPQSRVHQVSLNRPHGSTA